MSNNLNTLGIQEGVLKEYVERAGSLSIEEKGHALANNQSFYEKHNHYSDQGQTRPLREGESSNHHFICFTRIGENLYELDGGKSQPISHGQLTTDVLRGAVQAIRAKYMQDPTQLEFSLIALTPSYD
eukprot:TRINITY_DN2392_c0_g1_i2.p1 TRINITY_DN2392_c0_g1~~TRINITY_DN2392_c0_g1_i2.p1  ORF type:complete len:128 (-),score=20.20 TRINITY_DN2392_c0_g1_i2:40-423(-)